MFRLKEHAVVMGFYATLGIMGLGMAFTTSAAGQEPGATESRKDNPLFQNVKHTRADKCIDKTFLGIADEAQRTGRDIEIKGEAFDKIKNACKTVTRTDLGYYMHMKSVTFHP